MPILRPLPLLAVLLAGFPLGATAQETTQETGQPTVPAECEAGFGALDTDSNGFLSLAEAPRDHARAAIDNVTITAEGIARDDWLMLCASPHWQTNQPEEGAPFEGANSFTEEQARDRATAWQITEIGPLTLDDSGIWRGTGTLDGTAISFAIDYRGNVVITP